MSSECDTRMPTDGYSFEEWHAFYSAVDLESRLAPQKSRQQFEAVDNFARRSWFKLRNGTLSVGE